MTVEELAVRLALPAQTISALEEIEISTEQACKLKLCFLHDWDAFDSFAQNSHCGLPVLKLYLQWALDAKSEYDRLGIPESVYWDSIHDFTIWCHDFTDRTGLPGLQEWGWLGVTLRLEIFRLGRLQFEPTALDREISFRGKTYPAGTLVLGVHIPAGEPLDQEQVLDSLSQAAPFFHRYFGRKFELFHCHSWLLSPKLKQLMPPESRILQFQSLFTILDADDEPQAEERVFGMVSEHPETYPENTNLQRTMKRFIMEGNTIGMGMGVRPVANPQVS